MKKHYYYLLFIFLCIFSTTNTYSQDTDNDGVANAFDVDDDNDGISDSIECDATGTSLGDPNTISDLVYFQDFEGLPRLNDPLLNDGSEGFTTDLFHFSEPNRTAGQTNTNPTTNAIPLAVPDGSEYMIASDLDGNFNVLWGIATNGTVPNVLPPFITEPDGDFLLVNSFADPSSSYSLNSQFLLDNNDGDNITGEILSVDNIKLDRDGVYDFAVFITDVSNGGNNDNFYTFEVFDSVTGTLIPNASVTNGVLPRDDQWHLISLEFFITANTFSPLNVNREVNLILRQNTELGSGADIGIDNVFVSYRALDSDGDGIANCEDLDSDNDGILDSDESCNLVFSNPTLELPPSIQQVTNCTGNIWSNPNATYFIGPPESPCLNPFPTAGIITDHTTGLTTGGQVIGIQPGAGSDYIDVIEFNETADINTDYQLSLAHMIWARTGEFTADDRGEIRIFVNGNLERSLFGTAGLAFGVWEQDVIFFNTGANTNINVTIQIRRGAAVTGNDYMLDDIILGPLNCDLDTDGDGVPDRLDLDSDADGCPDLLEGGGNYTEADFVRNTDFDGGSTNVFYNLGSGPDTDNDGLIDIAEPFGQSSGSSQDNSLSNCPLGIDFDGLDDVIIAPNTFNLNGYTELTLQFWVKSNNASQINAGVIGQKGVIEITHNGNLECKLFSQGNEISFSDPLWLGNTNNWEHITLVFNRGTIQLYHNGLKQYESTDANLLSLETSTAPFTIGGPVSTTGPSNYFNGWIDEVRVFNLALSETQIQQTVYQEIEEAGGLVQGAVINKSIEDFNTGNAVSWSDLKLYYKMGSDFIGRQVVDNSANAFNGSPFNIYTQQEETAPLPYTATIAGAWDAESTWLHGNVWDIEDIPNNKDWSIVQISSNVTANHDMKNIGLIIDSGQKLTLSDGHVIENDWYLELNGTIDLQGDAQLIQTTNSDLVTSSTGSILRRQEGTGSAFWYNYWASPVGEPSASGLLNNNTTSNNTNNSSFKLDLLKDELGANWTFTPDYTASGSISDFWLYTYINGLSYWDWSKITTSTPINPGFGYTQKGTGIATNQQYIFEGKPNNGTILIDVLDRGGLGSEAGVSKTDFLLGNPYPSALDIHKFIDDNEGVIGGTLLLWQQWSGASHILDQYNGGYAQVTKTGSVRARQFVGLLGETKGAEVGTSLPSRYLPVGQGFFVEIIANGTVEFNNSQRVFIQESDGDGAYENGSVFFKNSADKTKSKTVASKDEAVNVFKKMRLEMISTSGPSTRRELLLGFSNTTTDDYDYGYDAENVDVSNNDIHLNLHGKDMNIQAYSDVTAAKVVPLNFKSSGNNTFEIKMTESENFDVNQEIYLKDTFTGTYFDLTKNTAYSFSSSQGKFNDRFEVVFQSEQQSLGIEETQQEQSFVYYQNDNQKLYAKKLNASIKRLALVNILGQSVLELENVSDTDLNNGINIPALTTGTYVAYFRTENNEVISKKLIIK